MGWLAAGVDYEVSLDEGKIVARNRQGRVLRSLPKAVRDTEAVLGLRQLNEWLVRHETSCRQQVEQWLVRSLPVPTALIGEVWADQAWRAPLRDLVVVPVDEAGHWDTERAGLLRDADVDKGLGIVDLDGETGRLTTTQVVLPHPVRLPDLADLREFAADLGVRQGTLQLFREVWTRPDDEDTRRRELTRYAAARYKELRHVQARATAVGYRVQGGTATLKVWEDGVPVVASVWIGDGDPGWETETGPLCFTDPSGEAVGPADVGPVAWSEGMRMAAALHAGRVVDEDGEPK
ncbi:DUF4132 domain-containing protein [Micromonospora sp. NPDC005806]|uniref:DUF4132 domain-containing protein n=1 Tax=Micromonospora sp. NPDC005806 TaxID=3364234 RepID=UPI0036C7CA4E